MPVDDTVLAQTIKDLEEKYNEVSLLRGKIRTCLASAQGIAEIDVPDPTEADPRQTKKQIPNDRILGTKLTTARRQEIYDMIESDKVALLE